ncbi:hypothetical protein MIND_00201900 [Mycena indigotica]|uniref:Uncharacterized protein n=1 Tax=Mycena indigotica TaxID=2126181 RepID=A0A8H6T9N7_9AGAR|nr:uncharacterized protein MIND_00201900 [Mycena indigotica]KAF7311905.1 hypothetical protein MIND_00201900 [Mycena indigotica]
MPNTILRASHATTESCYSAQSGETRLSFNPLTRPTTPSPIRSQLATSLTRFSSSCTNLSRPDSPPAFRDRSISRPTKIRSRSSTHSESERVRTVDRSKRDINRSLEQPSPTHSRKEPHPSPANTLRNFSTNPPSRPTTPISFLHRKINNPTQSTSQATNYMPFSAVSQPDPLSPTPSIIQRSRHNTPHIHWDGEAEPLKVRGKDRPERSVSPSRATPNLRVHLGRCYFEFGVVEKTR